MDTTQRPTRGSVSDLASLAKLDEGILLDEIRARFEDNKIYTYVGDILIAVNPFKDLGIYTKQYSKSYENIKRSEQPPHIFAVADCAYQALLGRGGRPPGNQCVLISGESGAGKTESTKLIIKQLVELCQSNPQLEQQILQVNPLLEAFGNAQTNLNDNSSRFGKYIQLKFSKGHVVGAKISEYLLEKSRVVRQNPGEENFHIFYYLFAANSHDKFGLGDPENYRYFSNGAQDFKKRINSLQTQYNDLVNAMDLVGFTDDEQMDMFSIIASVLHLGNISFKVNEDDSVNVTDKNGSIKTATSLLGIDTTEVEACLTCMVTVTRGDYIKRNYNEEQAQDARDAMAKALYGRLFGWIVNKANCLLVPDDMPLNNALTEIGILDIFGFEDFVKSGGKNSFEQACINLANEQLQFFFNQHIFKMEQEEYAKEGIDWKEIKFVDNEPLLNMFLSKPIGVMSLLDEESMFPKGTDQSYVDKLTKAFINNPYFFKTQQSNQATFSINHYAGKVTYSADRWLEKNRDTLPPGITEVLQSSKNSLIKTIFRGQITRTGSLALQGRSRKSTAKGTRKRTVGPASVGQDTAKRKLTVGGQFKNSLAILMERMTASTPIFVRCLKPNHTKQPGLLDTQYVLAQLLYTGMLETIEIRRKGFAVRPTFKEFIEKYRVLLDLKLTPSSQNCSKILTHARIQGCYVGTSKVFLKYKHVEQLTDLLDNVGRCATCLQKYYKGHLARKRFKVRLEKARREQKELEEMLKQAAQLSSSGFSSQQTLHEQDKNRLQERLTPTAPPPVPYFPSDGLYQQPGVYQLASASVASSERYLEPTAPSPPPAVRSLSTSSTGTQMEECGSGSDNDIIEDDFQPVTSLRRFGRPGTKHAAVNWFKETQTEYVIDQNQNRFAEWFHGIISRKESEYLLKDKIVGCFLIRVSESRFGYTLTFRAESRCRHYMIDQLKNGKFIIVGEPKVHRSLHALVSHHKKVKLSNWQHFLTAPCGQESGECDYSELVNDDVYFMLDPTYQDTAPEIPARNYSRHSAAPQNGNQRVKSAVEAPGNMAASRQSGRPLPHLPEEAYIQLMDEENKNQYESPETNGKKKTKKLSTSRSKFH